MDKFYALNISGVPTSGTIAMNELRGKAYATYILQQLSASAQTACMGYYSLYRVSSTYIGPTFTIRRSSDSATTNVYSDINGNMGLSLNGTGTSFASWIGASTAFITTWYDQSGAARNATQTNTGIQPILRTATMTIDFRTSRYFVLPDGTVPSGNLSYTVSCKHGAIDNSTGGMLGSGVPFVNRQANAFRRAATGYSHYWLALDLTTGTYAVNNACIWTYNGSQRSFYTNGTLTASDAASNRNSSTGNNKIGITFTELNGEYLNGDMYYLQIFNTPLDATDRSKLVK